MKTLISLIVLLTTCINVTFSQKATNIWYFGENAGIDFNSGAPTPLTDGAMIQREGCAIISDRNGNLLFYTEGVNIWNKNHLPMPNGFGLQGDVSSSQSSIIVPLPGSSTIYYVFTTSRWGFGSFMYSVVDMTQDAGLGDVTTKNISLFTPTTEKITAIPHANGCDIWVIAHEYNSDKFYAYLLSSTGLNTSPIISQIGKIHNVDMIDAAGCMKASADGNKLAVGIYGSNTVEIFDFDKSTGQVTNLNISFNVNVNVTPPTSLAYGVEFSPDNSRLYVSTLSSSSAPSYIFQYDLLAGSNAAIIASQYQLNTAMNVKYGTLQIAPDGKIYVARMDEGFLGTINNPNALGSTSNYLENGFYLGGKYSKIGLPNFFQNYFNFIITYQDTCLGDNTLFFISDTSSMDSVFWDFGDPATGINNFSTDLSPSHIFSSKGNYDVKLIQYFQCSADTLTQAIIIDELSINLGNDTNVCSGNSIALNATYSGATYLWSTNDTTQTINVNTSGFYSVQVQSGSCIAVDTIGVTFSNVADATITPVPSLCKTDAAITLSAVTLGGIWSGAGITDSINGTFVPIIADTGTHTITYNIGGSCGDTDNVNIVVSGCENSVIENSVIWVPNVFTPNNDGINEEFYAVGVNISCYQLMIFNRWGQLLFETIELNDTWDGTYKGNLVPDGVYVWVIRYCGLNNLKSFEKEMAGYVTVLK